MYAQIAIASTTFRFMSIVSKGLYVAEAVLPARYGYASTLFPKRWAQRWAQQTDARVQPGQVDR